MPRCAALVGLADIFIELEFGLSAVFCEPLQHNCAEATQANGEKEEFLPPSLPWLLRVKLPSHGLVAHAHAVEEPRGARAWAVVRRSQFEISRKYCCGSVMGLVHELVAPGMLVNVPVLAGALSSISEVKAPGVFAGLFSGGCPLSPIAAWSQRFEPVYGNWNAR